MGVSEAQGGALLPGAHENGMRKMDGTPEAVPSSLGPCLSPFIRLLPRQKG